MKRLYLSCGVVAMLTLACHDATVPDVPPTLSLGTASPHIGLMLGTEVRLPVVLRSARGDTLPLPPSFTLISRNPTVVSIEGSTVIRGRAMGSTWVVGTVVTNNSTATDSLEVTVSCTLELEVRFTPTSTTLTVGASFTPTIELWTCAGQVQLHDTFRWGAGDSTVIRVDSISGQTTGLRAGQTAVFPRGAVYRSLPGIPVTVIPSTP